MIDRKAILVLQAAGYGDKAIATSMQVHINAVLAVTSPEWVNERRVAMLAQIHERAAQEGARRQREALERARRSTVSPKPSIETGTTSTGMRFQVRNGISLAFVSAQIER